MDYTSFAPGKSARPAKPNLSLPELPSPHKSFTPKFIGFLAVIILIGIGAYAGLWYWQNQQDAYVAAPTYTPRATAVEYRDTQYGFYISLPDSWSGYTVLNSQWTGRDVATGKIIAQGPIITLRHPLWTAAAPREDMPVMVFTPAQWALVKAENMSLGAAPIQPSLLGQNSQYILALSARYNYDFKTGYEEVDQLVHTLKAIEPISAEGQHCGGFIQNAPTCPSGYTCKLDVSHPDTGGTCAKN